MELVSLALLKPWLAAKNLLRVWFAALVTAIMASSAYTLLINRLADPSVSALRAALWMMPIWSVFCARHLPNCAADAAPAVERPRNSPFAGQFGSSLFCRGELGLSLFFIKWPRFTTGVAIAPTATVIGATLVWLGGLFLRSANTYRAFARCFAEPDRFGILCWCSERLLARKFIRTLGLATAIVAGCAFIGHCYVSRSAWFSLPVLLICVALATIAGVNLFVMCFGWESGLGPIHDSHGLFLRPSLGANWSQPVDRRGVDGCRLTYHWCDAATMGTRDFARSNSRFCAASRCSVLC